MASKSKYVIVYAVMYLILSIRTLLLIPHGSCKYQPTCTVYAKEALLNLPLHRAILAIIKRIVKCNPLSNGGYDPVIEKKINV